MPESGLQEKEGDRGARPVCAGKRVSDEETEGEEREEKTEYRLPAAHMWCMLRDVRERAGREGISRRRSTAARSATENAGVRPVRPHEAVGLALARAERTE